MATKTYTTRAGQDAAERIGSTKFWTESYADHIEEGELRYADLFPDRADYFLTRTLGEALAGNDGN